MGHFGHLVRYLYVGISPRRVNRFSICLLIWTQLEQYLNPCNWRCVSFSRFREIGLYTYGHFVLLVTGTFHVSTCEMLKIDALTARIGSLNSICNEESPHIYFVWGFPRSRGSIFTLQMTPPTPLNTPVFQPLSGPLSSIQAVPQTHYGSHKPSDPMWIGPSCGYSCYSVYSELCLETEPENGSFWSFGTVPLCWNISS